ARAGTEPVHFNAQALEHAEVEIAERRRILDVELQVLAVPETAAGQKDRQVLHRVAAAVAQVAAEEDQRAVEQVGAVFLRVLQLGEQVANGLHRLDFDDLELRE